ncbi:Hydrogen cyanide synthase subunit HcnA [Rhodovastum atsumiense]|uniref:(2Fe-2S)-binding protein n=1 Tax=Rhodovastum atsumiense TaxID=504468 RepID=A0A5M6IUM0_9PROT|nr:(2Fe-2S)-binding protein [Rhodovastum atsumiense]KAA5611976.1 (2Fe-2S)-binding protein [Rhodovastum atsumiense]CAH2598755.1 Hydrogen cyanide synthase subunit HcnA [Rhodovastum atsumiense]
MFRTLSDPASATVTILIDGVPTPALPGETVAAVLLRQAEPWARAEADGTRRAPYCLAGACFECRARVDGAPSVRTCQVTVREGMRVERQSGLPEIGQ